MGSFYVCGAYKGFVSELCDRNDLIKNLIQSSVIVHDDDVYVINNGKIVQNNDKLQTDETYHVVSRLPGGKGGFGSMLRAIGAQIEKTTSREACRDLSGRRMRDINNEKKLKDWLGKQSEREREKEDKRKERIEKRKHRPQHKFDDPLYVEQKNKVVEDLEDALQKGLKKSKTVSATVTSGDVASGSGACRKRKATDKIKSESSKKNKGWLGLDPSLHLSDLDSCGDDAEDDDMGSSSDTNSNSQHSSDNSVSNSTEIPNGSTAANKLSGEESDKELTDKLIDPDSKPTSSPDNQQTLLESLPPPGNHQQLDNEPVNLEEYQSVEDLERLGLNRLKNALTERRLKCGGTLTQRAERLFSVKGLQPEQIDAFFFAKPSKKK